MAKKSQRRFVHHERGQSGCMSGFIGIFDFRQGRFTQKLLSDKRHGSSRHAAGTAPAKGRLKLLSHSDKKHQGSDTDVDGVSDGGETEIAKVGISKTSVKKLIEEDMSSEQQTDPSTAIEQIRSEPGCKGNAGKNHKQTKKAYKVAYDIHVQDSKAYSTTESQKYNQPNSAKLSHLDITSLMEEFCSQIQHRQELHLHHEKGGDSCGVKECTDFATHNHIDELDMHLVQKHSVLQEKLSEAAEAFLNHKLIDPKQLTEDGAIHQSKQFIDALDILNSNKDLLLKLLQDSNSLLVKHIQDLQDAPSEKVNQDKLLGGAKLSEGIGNSRQAEELVRRKEVQKHNIHNFFRKKDKSQKRNSSKESDNPQVSNRIVVLKPKATGIQNSVTADSPSSSLQSRYILRNQGWSGRFNSQFSLSEIKKKLKNTIGENRKDRHWISMDGQIPNKHQDSRNSGKVDPNNIGGRELPSRSHLDIKRTSKPSNTDEREEKIEKANPSTAHDVASTRAASCKDLTMTTVGYPKQRESNIYVEAKKHLQEILTGGGEDGSFPYQQNPKTLGRILSLPEYTSTSLCSPGRDGEHGFVTAQMRFSPNSTLRIVNENIWRFKADNNASRPSPSKKKLDIQEDAANGDDSDIKFQEVDSKPDSSKKVLPVTEIHESINSSKEDSSPKGDAEIMEETEVASLEENNSSDGNSKLNSSTPFSNTGTTKSWEEEEESAKCLRPESSEDDGSPSSSLCSFSSSSLLIQKVDALETINDPPERPSPISVLEPCFEDINSPTTTALQAEVQNQRLHFHIEEDDSSTVVVTTSNLFNYPRPCMEDEVLPLEYVTAVLQASNVNWDELLGKYHSSELFLNFDEVELIPTQHYGDDKKLLFDCINEVLGELYERYFGSSPWVAFVSPDIRPAPIGKNIIHEVWEGINWNILPQLMPRSLDQIIGKDMGKDRIWMDFRSDAEVIGNEMVEAILEELMEYSLLDLCS